MFHILLCKELDKLSLWQSDEKSVDTCMLLFKGWQTLWSGIINWHHSEAFECFEFQVVQCIILRSKCLLSDTLTHRHTFMGISGNLFSYFSWAWKHFMPWPSYRHFVLFYPSILPLVCRSICISLSPKLQNTWINNYDIAIWTNQILGRNITKYVKKIQFWSHKSIQMYKMENFIN